MTDHYDEYRAAVNLAMLNYQFIEQMLKECIGRSYHIVRLSLNGIIPFKLSIDDVADAPLGNLVKRFGQLCDDADLVGKLSGIVKARNEAAHRALLVGIDEVSPGGAKETEAAKLQAKNDELKALLHLLFNYCNALDTKIQELDRAGRGA